RAPVAVGAAVEVGVAEVTSARVLPAAGSSQPAMESARRLPQRMRVLMGDHVVPPTPAASRAGGTVCCILRIEAPSAARLGGGAPEAHVDVVFVTRPVTDDAFAAGARVLKPGLELSLGGAAALGFGVELALQPAV